MTFTDTEFEVSDYDVTVLDGAPKTNGYTLSNIGGELRVRMPLEFSGSALFIANSIFIADPGTLGQINSINVSFNAGVLNGNAAVGAMLVQDGLFVSGGTIVTRSDDFDVSYSFGSSDSLDFSPTGSPIGIGFRTSANGATFDVNYRVDNYVATVTSIPEPNSIVLFSACSLACFALRRRTR